MALIDELKRETDEIVKGGWTRRQGQVVPEPEDLRLTNDAVDLQATFLYADLADSTELVLLKQEIAAEVMRAYLRGATRIIRSCGGEIRSFDGDRVMGVFIEGAKNTSAAKAGLQINYFFTEILKPAFANFYTARFPSQFDLRQTVGIDTGDVMVVRGGLRDDNDLVWVPRWTSENRPMMDTSKPANGGTRQEYLYTADGGASKHFSERRHGSAYTGHTWAEDMATQGCDRSADSAAGIARSGSSRSASQTAILARKR